MLLPFYISASSSTVIIIIIDIIDTGYFIFKLFLLAQNNQLLSPAATTAVALDVTSVVMCVLVFVTLPTPLIAVGHSVRASGGGGNGGDSDLVEGKVLQVGVCQPQVDAELATTGGAGVAPVTSAAGAAGITPAAADGTGEVLHARVGVPARQDVAEHQSTVAAGEHTQGWQHGRCRGGRGERGGTQVVTTVTATTNTVTVTVTGGRVSASVKGQEWEDCVSLVHQRVQVLTIIQNTNNMCFKKIQAI